MPLPKDQKITIALAALKAVLWQRFGAVELVLFGSVARGSQTPDSDIDLLVLLPGPVTTATEEAVFDLAFDVEMAYGVVFGIIVYARAEWDSARFASMPLHSVIEREGVQV